MIPNVSGVDERLPREPGEHHIAANVLLVDDRPANLQALEAVLEPIGANLVRAQSGEEALRHILSTDFAVVLLDVHMPGMNGFETAAWIRHRERTRGLPIIFMSAVHTDTESARKAYSLGAFDYVTKPFDPEILRFKVGAFVELYTRGVQLQAKEVELRAKHNALSEARGAIRTKDEFISILGHDLRGPLNTIVVGATLMTEDAELPARHRKNAQRIVDSGHRMNRLVGDLLDFARTSLGGGIPVTRMASDMGQACRGIVEELQLANPAREISFHSEGDHHGEWDRDRVSQVVGNLVGNGLQHSHGGPVRLALVEEGAMVVMKVSNQGVIADDIIPLLFEPFRHRNGGHRAGLGLGLYIVREIVRAHGGTVEVACDGELNQTTFMVRMPKRPAIAMNAELQSLSQ
jgi:signal transduction histidine kinase